MRNALFAAVCALAACGSPPANHAANDLFAFDKHHGEPAADAVQAHIRASLVAHTPAYESTLATMQGHGADAVRVLTDEYSTQPHARHFQRWLLVHTLSKVQHGASAQFFTDVLHQAMPQESGDAHHYSDVEEERLLQMAALEGLGHLARGGNGDALAVLHELAASSVATLRNGAMRELGGQP